MTLYLSNRDGNGKTSEEGHYRLQTALLSGNTLQSTSLAVTQNSPTGLSVLVAPGDFKIDTTSGYSYTGWNNISTAVTITTADPSNPRITTIVAYVDKGASTSASPPNNPGIIKFMAVNGTPQAVPVAPIDATIQTAVGAGNPFIAIADVRVNAGATSILNTHITDRRAPITLFADMFTTDSAMADKDTRKVPSQAAIKDYSDFNFDATATLTNFNLPAFLKPRKYKISGNATMSAITNRPTNATAGFGETLSINGVGATAGIAYTYSTQIWINYTGEQFVRMVSTDGAGTIIYGTWYQTIYRGDDGWITPTMANSWVRYDTTYDNAGYFKDSMNFVHLRGLIRSGTASTVFQLPVGYRPLMRKIFPSVSNQTISRTDVRPDGWIEFSAYNNAWVSMEGITFRAEQ